MDIVDMEPVTQALPKLLKPDGVQVYSPIYISTSVA
jgi:hypothetical protein